MKKILLLISLLYSRMILASTNIAEGSIISNAEVLKLFGSLASVILLVLIFSYAFKKMNGLSFSGDEHIKIISSLAVSQKEKIILVEVGGENLLLGISSGGVSLLKSIDLTKVNAITKKNENTFPKAFKQFLNKAT